MTSRPVIANIIARNEADNYLSKILDRLKDQVDMIVFTDDCSDDDTPNIAEGVGAKVFQMSEPTFESNEGKIRQQSWENLQTVIPTEDCFILAIDCDEMLYETRFTLQQLAEQDNFEVISIEFYHMWNEDQFRVDKAWCPHPSSRMFKYHPNGRFLDRKLACGSEPTYVQDLIRNRLYLRDSGLLMKHLSYIKDVDKKAKYDRYMALDGGAFHSNAHIISIMDEEPKLIDWQWLD